MPRYMRTAKVRKSLRNCTDMPETSVLFKAIVFQSRMDSITCVFAFKIAFYAVKLLLFSTVIGSEESFYSEIVVLL